jgi:hypothetical protein
MKVKASENKVTELEKIEDMNFNSGRYMINGRHQGGYDINQMKNAEQKVIRDKFPLPEEEVEITSFREAMYHKYGGRAVSQIVPIKPYDIGKETWDGGFSTGPTSIVNSPYNSSRRSRQPTTFLPSVNYRESRISYE